MQPMNISELRHELYDVDVRLDDALRRLRRQRVYLRTMDAAEYQDTMQTLLCCLLREFRELEIWRDSIVESIEGYLPVRQDWRLSRHRAARPNTRKPKTRHRLAKPSRRKTAGWPALGLDDTDLCKSRVPLKLHRAHAESH
jgi:hypothetical protein